jgi:hypothetical protein
MAKSIRDRERHQARQAPPLALLPVTARAERAVQGRAVGGEFPLAEFDGPDPVLRQVDVAQFLAPRRQGIKGKLLDLFLRQRRGWHLGSRHHGSGRAEVLGHPIFHAARAGDLVEADLPRVFEASQGKVRPVIAPNAVHLVAAEAPGGEERALGRHQARRSHARPQIDGEQRKITLGDRPEGLPRAGAGSVRFRQVLGVPIRVEGHQSRARQIGSFHSPLIGTYGAPLAVDAMTGIAVQPRESERGRLKVRLARHV